mmetsp:Transcript_6246/g.11461  ORF Transcript_6246/g.11461 Transcript_6246/m.11461 type:complete len:550 (-) Transcript_6246:241-1890(-)
MIVLYLFLMIIRFALIFGFYPVTKRIGIGTNVRESLFSSWAGLRGAVGIALALSINSDVVHLTSSGAVDESTRAKYLDYTEKLFGFVGGIAFLTLVINATLSGPILKRLGLVTPSDTREKIVKNYRDHVVAYTLGQYVRLLSEERFHLLDFSVIKKHVPFLSNITYEQLMNEVHKYKKNTPVHEFVEPNLENIIPYLYEFDQPVAVKNKNVEVENISPERRRVLKDVRRQSVVNIHKDRKEKAVVFNLSEHSDVNVVYEERIVFINILRSTYHKLIEHGEIVSRGFMPYSLFKSLDVASDAASRGFSLNDWDALMAVTKGWVHPAARKVQNILYNIMRMMSRHPGVNYDSDYLVMIVQITQALAFVKTHEDAQKFFMEEFSSSEEENLTTAERKVLEESAAQIEKAKDMLKSLDFDDVLMIKSRYACQILLNRSARYFEKLNKRGLVSDKEAGEFLDEVENYINSTLEPHENTQYSRMSSGAKVNRLRSLPEYMLTDLEGKIFHTRSGNETLQGESEGASEGQFAESYLSSSGDHPASHVDSSLLEPLL